MHIEKSTPRRRSRARRGRRLNSCGESVGWSESPRVMSPLPHRELFNMSSTQTLTHVCSGRSRHHRTQERVDSVRPIGRLRGSGLVSWPCFERSFPAMARWHMRAALAIVSCTVTLNTGTLGYLAPGQSSSMSTTPRARRGVRALKAATLPKVAEGDAKAESSPLRSVDVRSRVRRRALSLRARERQHRTSSARQKRPPSLRERERQHRAPSARQRRPRTPSARQKHPRPIERESAGTGRRARVKRHPPAPRCTPRSRPWTCA